MVVINCSSFASFRLNVSGRMSMKTGVAPRSTKALAVETKVKEGTITSSPDWMFNNSAAISSAWVQEVVSSAFGTKRVSSVLLKQAVELPLTVPIA